MEAVLNIVGLQAMMEAGAVAMKEAGVEAMSKAGAVATRVAGVGAMKEAGVGVEGAMVVVEGEEWVAVGEGTERRRKIHGLLVFLQCMLYNQGKR